MEFLTLSDRIDLGVMGGFGELNEALNCDGFVAPPLGTRRLPHAKKTYRRMGEDEAAKGSTSGEDIAKRLFQLTLRLFQNRPLPRQRGYPHRT